NSTTDLAKIGQLADRSRFERRWKCCLVGFGLNRRRVGQWLQLGSPSRLARTCPRPAQKARTDKPDFWHAATVSCQICSFLDRDVGLGTWGWSPPERENHQSTTACKTSAERTLRHNCGGLLLRQAGPCTGLYQDAMKHLFPARLPKVVARNGGIGC